MELSIEEWVKNAIKEHGDTPIDPEYQKYMEYRQAVIDNLQKQARL